MPTPILTDTFTDTAGRDLSAHTADTGATWSYCTDQPSPAMAITAAGRLRNNTNGQSIPITSAISASSAVTVTWDLYAASLAGFIGVGVGAQSGTSYGGYEARYETSFGGFVIYAFGTGQSLSSIAYPLTVGQSYHCQFVVPDPAVSTIKTLYVNGTAVLTASNSSYSTAGRVFIDTYSSPAATDATGLQIDNLNYYNTAFTPGSGGTALAPDSAAIILSPGNQYIVPGTSLEWIHTATGAKFSFTGTSLGVTLDLSPLTSASIATANYPYLNWSIDGGSWQRAQANSTLLLATGLSSGSHTAEVRYEPNDESDTWTPHSAVKVTGWTVDTGSAISAPTGNAAARSKLAMLMGDSITRGYAAANMALQSFGVLLGHALDAEMGITAYSGQGWGHAATSVAPVFPSTFGYYDSTHPRAFPTLDYFLIAHGTNDAGTANLSTLVKTTLATIRTAIGGHPLLVILIPANGEQDSPITAGATAYIASSLDEKVLIVDLSSRHYGFATTPGSAAQYSVDGIHPTTESHALIAADIAAAIKAYEGQSTSASAGISHTVGGGVLSGL